MTDLPIAALVAATFVLAGLVKGVIGLGLPTISMGILGSVMSPAQAAALLVVPSLVTNLVQMAGGPALGPLLRRLWPMQLGILLGCLPGVWWLGGTGGRGATLGLGLALLAYAAIGLLPFKLPRVPARHEGWAGPLTGALTGAVTGATGVFVLPAVPYLGALGLARDELVQALGISFTVATLALALTLGVAGGFDAGTATTSLLALAPALAGLWLGGALRQRVRPETFRRLFFLGMLAIGAQLVWRGI